jgi:uncharacterized alpha-E superfamily protein
MLSRVADCLYWMSRYVERAENIARILDVNLQLMLDLPTQQAKQLDKNWLSIAACLGDDQTCRKQRSKADCASVTDFLTFDRDNPNSVVSCLCAARENARTVREQISTEMWEQLNRAYLWATGRPARTAFERSQYTFFQYVKEISHLFQGITDASMTHGEGWEFIQIGKHLERADKTSRVLDDKFHLLHVPALGSNDPRQWGAVLRSCSARQAYQKIYVSEVQPAKVSELLLLNEAFPRSVLFCISEVDQALRRISGVSPGRFANQAERLSGRLLSELRYSTIEELVEPGLTRTADLLQTRFNQIGEAIFQTYINLALPVEPRPLKPSKSAAASQAQVQPQQ